MTNETPPPIRFLRLAEVVARVAVADVTIYRWEKERLFPRRRKIGKNSVAWVESEIDEWCASKAAQISGESE